VADLRIMASGSLTCSSPEIENHLSITAREGDLNAVGNQLKAGNDVALSASRDLNLISAANTSLLEGKNESKGGTVGVGIGVGSGGWGISVSASVNKGKGSESGNGTTHSETTVDAGNSLILNSGRDTTLTGAQVSGDTVIADIGRNLTLTSEQDSDRYDSKQQNASAGGSFTFGSMSGSASVNLSKDKMHSNYDSVVEQTGIFAGKGGYDITVGEHTQLDGAVIGSTATADKNRLDTGTLGWGDIDNRADFKTEHQSVGFSSGGSIGSQFAGNMANGLLTGGNNEGHDSSTTHAAISEGDIIVRDKDRQQQDVANLSRDVEHANQTLSPIFDKEKEQQRLQQTQLIGEIGNQVADIARTEGQISAINAGKAELAKKGITEPEKGASKEAWERYNAQLAATDGYKAAQQQWGTGSSVQQAIQAATAAVQGLAGSDLKAALAGGAAPYVAEVIGHYSNLDDAGKVAAHAVVNAALAAAQNQSALAGAAGAATAEIVGIIATQMYGKPVSELDETQKQTVSTLATLAAGLAGDSSASAVSGAQAGKTTVENNNLALIARGCAALSPCRNKVAEQLLEIGAKAGIVGLAGAAIKDVADKMTSDELDHLITLEMMGNDEITGKYLSSLQDKYGSGSESGPNMGKNLTDAEKAELGGAGSGTPGGWEPQDEEKARGSEAGQKPATREQIGKWSIDELSDGAKHIDPASKKGDLTLAGRALQKHGSREGSAFPSAKGNPSAINEQGQKIVDSILNDPNKSVVQSNTGRYGQVTDIISSSGRGLRYDAQGKLIGFLEPPK